MIGIDISSWQRGLDLAPLKEAGCEFAIIRAAQACRADSEGPGFYIAARQIGLPCGVYQYSEATSPTEAEKEARYLLSLINGRPMPCGVWMDVETPEQLALPNDVLLDAARAWCRAIREAGYLPGVYSSELSAWSKFAPADLGEDVLVWVAHYGKSPAMPCDLWQYTDQYQVAGYDFRLDIDLVRSDRFQRIAEAATASPPADHPDPPGEPGEPGDAPDISGALELVAEFLKTDACRDLFAVFIANRKG